MHLYSTLRWTEGSTEFPKQTYNLTPTHWHSDLPCWTCPKQKHVFFQRWSVLTNEWHSNGYKSGPQLHLSLYWTLNKKCSKTTANQCLRYIKDISMMALVQHQWVTVNFWTSLSLCRTSILPWSSRTKSLNNRLHFRTWTVPWNKENKLQSNRFSLVPVIPFIVQP